MRLGIFGGSFDPPHVGHLLAANDAFEQLSLDRLLFVPTATQPLKAGRAVASASQRLAMVRLLVEGTLGSRSPPSKWIGPDYLSPWIP